jgi:hypothetical protein
MEEKPDIRQVRILIEMVDPAAVQTARTADDSVDFVALRK